MTSGRLGATSLTYYAFMALPLAFVGLPLYIHMPDFYTQEFGLSLGALGGILLAIRSFDAVQDPIIGYLSDRLHARRFSTVFLGLSLVLIGMAGLVYGPMINFPVALWFAIFMVLATTGFSIASINLNLLGGFWRDSNAQRARISAWRETFALGGLLLAAVLPTLVAEVLPGKQAFIALFWVLAGLTGIAVSLFLQFARQFRDYNCLQTYRAAGNFNLWPIVGGKNRKFFTVCFLSYLASSLPAVLVLFFVRDYLGAESLSGLFLVLYFLSGAAFMGLWSKLAARKGLYIAWLVSMLVAVTTFFGATFLQSGDVVAYGIICVFSGMALGGDLALPPAIIAERVQVDGAQHQATQYYAMLAFLAKFSMAIAAAASFGLLQLVGFESAELNHATALNTLIVCYALVPCLLKLLAALFLWQLLSQGGNHNETSQRNINHGTTNAP